MENHLLSSGFNKKFLLMALFFLVVGQPSVAQTYYGGKYRPGPWAKAHATFYGDESAASTMGGACGYGNSISNGYGLDTTAVSPFLFNNGYGCGECYEVRCAKSPHCYYGSASAVVTATNLSPPSWVQERGWSNPHRVHFDLSKPAFMKIADWKAGIVPITYRRVPCKRAGGIRFSFQGNGYWLLVFAMNVGGPGDVGRMWVRGSRTQWISMTHNWGVSYHAFAQLGGQSLSFRLDSYSTRQVVLAWNVAPANWKTGMTYRSNVNFR